MTCYDVVVDSKWTLTYLEICKLKMAFYDIVNDSKWIIDLFSDLLL